MNRKLPLNHHLTMMPVARHRHEIDIRLRLTRTVQASRQAAQPRPKNSFEDFLRVFVDLKSLRPCIYHTIIHRDPLLHQTSRRLPSSSDISIVRAADGHPRKTNLSPRCCTPRWRFRRDEMKAGETSYFQDAWTCGEANASGSHPTSAHYTSMIGGDIRDVRYSRHAFL